MHEQGDGLEAKLLGLALASGKGRRHHEQQCDSACHCGISVTEVLKKSGKISEGVLLQGWVTSHHASCMKQETSDARNHRNEPRLLFSFSSSLYWPGWPFTESHAHRHLPVFLHSHPIPTAQESSPGVLHWPRVTFWPPATFILHDERQRTDAHKHFVYLCWSGPSLMEQQKRKWLYFYFSLFSALSITAGPNTAITASHMYVNGLHDIAFTDFYVPLHFVTFWPALLACISNYLAISWKTCLFPLLKPISSHCSKSKGCLNSSYALLKAFNSDKNRKKKKTFHINYSCTHIFPFLLVYTFFA